MLKVFNTLPLKWIFWKTKTFFKKMEYQFLVESTKIENALVIYKTANSETGAKWNYHKEQRFCQPLFLKILLQYKNLL